MLDTSAIINAPLFEPTYYGGSEDKASLLAQRKEAKINDLQKKVDPNANLEKSVTQMPDGSFESNSNKIWNDMNDAEYQAIVGMAIHDNAQVEKNGKSYFAKDGKEYNGKLEWFYMGQGKQDPNVFKVGIARGDLDSPSQRYIPNEAGTYGWESGPQGVNPDSIHGVLLPYSVAVGLEGLAHGRQAALENRLAATGQSEAKEALGPGYTEYYKGGSQGVFGDSRDDGAYSTEALKERWNGYLSDIQMNNIRMGIVDEDLYKKAIKHDVDKYEADHMSGMDRVFNSIAAFPTAIGKELVLDGLDVIGETAKKKLGIGFDLGDDQKKMDMVSDLFGYNQIFTERGGQKAKEHATKIFEGLTKEGKDVEFGDIKGLVQAGLETPEMLTYSLGYLASLAAGFGKFTKTGKALSDIEKAYKTGNLTKEAVKGQVAAIKATETMGQLASRVGLQNAGFTTVVAGNVNDQIDEFKKNNNGEGPTDTQVIRMLATEGVMASIDRFTDMSILRTPAALKELTAAVKFIPEDKAAALAVKVVTGSAKIAAAAGIEAAQEYTQTMGEVFNKQFQSEKYGNDAMAILTSPENVIEGIAAAGMGAAMGGEMKAGSMALGGLPSALGSMVSGTGAMLGKVSNMLPRTAEEKQLAAEADEIKTEQAETKIQDKTYVQNYNNFKSSLETNFFNQIAVKEGLDPATVTPEQKAEYTTHPEFQKAVKETLKRSMLQREQSSERPDVNVTNLLKGMRLSGDHELATEIVDTIVSMKGDEKVRSLYGSDQEFLDLMYTMAAAKPDITEMDVQGIVDTARTAYGDKIDLGTVKEIMEAGRLETSLASSLSSTGKSLNQVAEEVSSGPLGMVNYFKRALIAKATKKKDSKDYDTARTQLVRLTSLQEKKLEIIEASIKKLQDDLRPRYVLHLQSTLQKMGVSSRSEATDAQLTEAKNITTKRLLSEVKGKTTRIQFPSEGKDNGFTLYLENIVRNTGGIFKVVDSVRNEVAVGKDLMASLDTGVSIKKSKFLNPRPAANLRPEAVVEKTEIPIEEKSAVVEEIKIPAQQEPESTIVTKSTPVKEELNLVVDGKTVSVENESKTTTEEIKSSVENTTSEEVSGFEPAWEPITYDDMYENTYEEDMYEQYEDTVKSQEEPTFFAEETSTSKKENTQSSKEYSQDRVVAYEKRKTYLENLKLRTQEAHKKLKDKISTIHTTLGITIPDVTFDGDTDMLIGYVNTKAEALIESLRDIESKHNTKNVQLMISTLEKLMEDC